jgi:hypothetical protein
MARRLVKWFLELIEGKPVLKLSKALEDPKATAVIEAEFPLAELFPTINEMTDVQRQLCIFAVKQKLMDSGASDIGEYQSKIGAAKDKWKELLEGKWTGERTNATGAAENKVLAGKVKEVLGSTVVSLNQLILKQMLHPETFTEEDEAKLHEFLVEAAKQERKSKKKE